jgi:hypothetical protein
LPLEGRWQPISSTATGSERSTEKGDRAKTPLPHALLGLVMLIILAIVGT